MKELNFAGRITPQRRKIWEVLMRSYDHPTAVEVYERVRKENCSISFATVYNTLNYFRDLGLVQELKVDREASRYDARREPHGHLHCLGCGILVDLMNPGPLSTTPSKEWEIVALEIIFHGYCPDCRVKAKAVTKG